MLSGSNQVNIAHLIRDNNGGVLIYAYLKTLPRPRFLVMPVLTNISLSRLSFRRFIDLISFKNVCVLFFIILDIIRTKYKPTKRVI